MKTQTTSALKTARKRLSVLTFTLFVLFASGGFSQEATESLSYQEGEFWQFKYRSWGWMELSYDSGRLSDGIYEVVYSQNHFRTFYLGSQGKEELSPANAKLMYLVNPGQDFKSPLKRGSKWSYECRRSIPAGRGAGVKMKTQFRTVQLHVQGKQEVTTDAGSFEAFEVVKADTLNGKSRGGAVTRYWFSPDTRSIVKMSSRLLEDANAANGQVEILLVKHGVGSTDINISDEPKRQPEIQKQSKLD